MSDPQSRCRYPVAMVDVEKFDGGVWVMTLQCSPDAKGNFQNRFEPELMLEVDGAISRILDFRANDGSDDPCAIVLTSKGKFFSNGHDVDWLEAAARKEGTGQESASMKFIDGFYSLLRRIMCLEVPTIAAINGHAFAGGCLLAMSLDYRVMNGVKGFICMNEVDMLVNIRPEDVEASFVKPGSFPGADTKMTSILRSKLPQSVIRTMYLEGKRFQASEAHAFGIVDEVGQDENETREKAMQLARELAKKGVRRNRRTVQVLKTELFQEHLSRL